MRKPIVSDKGAPPQGPYSPAIVAEGPCVYVSGQGPIDPQSGEFCIGNFQDEVELTFKNVGALLEAAGTSWAHAVKVNIYLADLNNFAVMNEIYKRFVPEPYPARTTVEAGLNKIAIEVDCIATIPKD